MAFRKKFKSYSLLTTLMLLSGLLMLIFFSKEQILHYQKVTHNEYYHYLEDRFQLADIMKSGNNDEDCQLQKKEEVIKKHKKIKFSFLCRFSSIFLNRKPETTEKYIAFSNIEDYLDIPTYQDKVFYIRSLKELPPSSIDNPKIVFVLNSIDESLAKDFYGVIITQHYFHIAGKHKKVYGVLYSSYNNKAVNIIHNKEVVNNLEQQFSHWEYVPHSKSFLNSLD